MTTYKINYQKYLTGAGILLLEKYNNEWIVILFKDHTKTFADIGGLYESKHGDVKETAKQELEEESRNLFKINNNEILTNYLDIKYNSNIYDYYRLYLLNITDIGFKNYGSLPDYKTLFEKNRDIINNNPNYSKSWKETTEIKRFKLIDLLNLVYQDNLYCKDMFGETHKIRRRVKDIMIEINKIDKFEELVPPIINKSRMPNPDGTTTYNLY